MKPFGKHEDSSLSRAIDGLLDKHMLASFTRHGNMTWGLESLVTMALCWAWGGEQSLQQRFSAGLKILATLFPHGQWGRTYQGFLPILRTWSDNLRTLLITRLRQQMLELTDRAGLLHGWIVMAVDGTRVEAPRTDANLEHFGRRVGRRRPSRRKSSARKTSQPAAPQVWVTVMWHVGLGIVWDWRRGPTGSSERAHLREMIPALPAGSLLVADAGFQGYEYWQELIKQGHSFVIRVAGHVRLLKGLGFSRRHRNIVYLWPDKNRRRQEPPLLLRLEQFHDGRRTLWLITNVLDRQRLSTRAMQEIYHRRWGVEVFIRGFKQTFGRGKLRSHAPHNVELELDWSLLALWSLELMAARELISRGESPQQLSTAAALRAIRDTLYAATLGCDVELFDRLGAIRHDGYRRQHKAIRDWPRKKSEAPIGRPIINLANHEQIKAAYELRTAIA